MASMTRARSRLPGLQLLIVVLILLVHLYLRIHHPTALAAFIDEYRHISRGQEVYEFEQNPIEFAHGKLLLYYWLGLFSPSGAGALVVSRMAVALISLLTAAASAGIASQLFGRRAILPALAYYALVPHAVFFERMAFADPLAGAFAALTAWQVVRLARRPTRRRAVVAGLLIGATVLAKLTTVLIMGLPLVAVILLGSVWPEGWSRAALIAWGKALWQRYGGALSIIRKLVLLPWLLLLTLSALALLSGRTPVIMTSHLIQVELNSVARFTDRFEVGYTILDTLISAPMALLLLSSIVWLLYRHPRRTLFLLIWLGQLTIPSFLLTWQPETRYLMVGQSALAVLFAGGVADIWGVLRNAWSEHRGVKRALLPAGSAAASAVIVAGWAVSFALPFSRQAATHPEALALPPTDSYIFFAGTTNAWGVREALAYLEEHGERVDDRVPVVAILLAPGDAPEYCDLFKLYTEGSFNWNCVTPSDDAETVSNLQEHLAELIEEQAGGLPFWYVVTNVPPDQSEHVNIELDEPPIRFEKPQDGPPVTAWRMRPA